MTANTSATGGYLRPVSTAPAEDDALADVLQALVKGVTGLPGQMVRPRWQTIPPKQPPADVDWCGIGVLSITPVEGNISQRHIAAGFGTSESFHDVVLDVQASFYGPHSSGLANTLRDGLMIAQNREEMMRQNMALVATPGPTMKTVELVNTQYLNRSDISFQVRRRVARTWAIQNVLSVGGAILSDQGLDEPAVEQPFIVTEE